MTDFTESNDSGDNEQAEAAGLTFPCVFPVKAMGKSGLDLQQVVLDIVIRHASVADDTVACRPSKGGNYESITVTARVESRSQLEALYAELSGHDQVLWTL